MMRAIWNGVVIAETPGTKVVEGNHYFPPDSLHHEYFSQSSTWSLCPCKGIAPYYTLTVGGQPNPMPPRITRIPSRWPVGSRTTSRSGTAWSSMAPARTSRTRAVSNRLRPAHASSKPLVWGCARYGSVRHPV
jgi:hypothetical protein